MKKYIAFLLSFIFSSTLMASECGEMQIESLQSCLAVKGGYVALSNYDENVRIDLIVNGKVVSSHDGHGYVFKSFNSDEKDVSVKLLHTSFGELVSFRTLGDKISFIYFYSVNRKNLELKSVFLKNGQTESGIQVNNSSLITIDENNILVNDSFYEASYQISKKGIVLKTYRNK